MSPNSTARHWTTARRIALCAAALIVTVLPTACGAAYADSETGHAGHHSTGPDGSDVVEVGGVDAADPRPDDEADAEADAEGGADDAEQGGEQTGERRGDQQRDEQGDQQGDQEEPAADEGGEAAAQGRQEEPAAEENGDAAGEGLDVLGTDCTNSELEPHDGFQEAPRCVSTSFGEVAAEEKSPSLLITEAPRSVKAQEEFTLSVSTRNLVRDRFLGAAAGGYYKESSFLDGSGIQRGHFHTACRMLDRVDVAPDAAPEPEFFLATQDNGGGAGADTVKITVDGMPGPGTAQCAVWAGDGSHRVPMMQRADQTPAFDVVRIPVE
ncbi:Pecanex-like protein 1 [Pseudonocardia kunmingensis]|uniref:Pecanex-like protein 1 n=1 Tax=Pseudonocardia kunmingensis TaxID=630975 RepID=A0A543E2Y1_9PSEU|nr:Pecanex-like protein 1 [Pseudonocardia kunmingensis]TQM15971.1 hypothetical protein FB558_2768 [Pseudonocardia kunmingensis]